VFLQTASTSTKIVQKWTDPCA